MPVVGVSSLGFAVAEHVRGQDPGSLRRSRVWMIPDLPVRWRRHETGHLNLGKGLNFLVQMLQGDGMRDQP